MVPTPATAEPTPGAAASADGAGRRALWIIFGVALAVRLAYTLVTYAVLGPDGLLAPDSQSYLTKASQFVDAARAGALSGWDWLGPDTGLMPMVVWFLGAVQALTGASGPLAPALLQGGLDALACVVIAHMAATLDPRLASPAGWFAALTPTLIVMSGLVLTDSLFLLASAVSLLAALRWLRHQGWRWAITLGVALGCAALTRVAILPWAVAVTVGLGCAVAWRRRLTWAHVAQLGVGLAVALTLFAPVPARNLDRYDSFALTSQTGSYVLLWLVPLTMEADDGTLHSEGARRMNQRFAAIQPRKAANPFQQSAAMTSLGLEALVALGPVAIIKSWAMGGAINLVSPAATVAPLAARLPHAGFYATPGQSGLDKIWNFLFANNNPVYAWLLVLGGLGVALARAVQLVGLIAGFRRNPEIGVAILILLAWVGFILAVNGPIASPKYRLPIEPTLAVYFAFGYRSVKAWLRRAGPAKPARSR